MGITDSIIKFSLKKNLEKWVKGAATAAVSVSTPLIFKYFGVELTSEQKLAASAAVGSAIIGLSNFLKVKFPSQFGWL